METSMKNISGIVPVILAAVVGIGAVVSLSDYTAPVYGSESEDELTETETIIESAGMESVEETEVENTEAAAVLDGAFDLADGTYEGSANGFSGKIKVSVVIKNQTIRSINILSNSDDEAFFNRAKEGVTASILAKQSTDVDTVSGATYSSRGIMNAVNAGVSVCLCSAELDMGAFDTVSRATTNHGLHRGSYQCTSEITKKDGTKLKVAYYTGAATGVLTNGETFSYDKNEIESYVVTGLKYVPVKVKTEDYEAFKAAYTVVENGSTLSGGFSEGNLKNYTDLVAEVTENTNGLKTVTQNEDGSFSFAARVNNGTDSGIKDAALKTAENITTTVKEANGSYGEFLRVDLTGEGYGALGADMQAAEWTYYGSDSTYTDPLQSYGTKFASDNWMNKAQGIQLGLTDSLRCKLPAGTDGTGYWTITVYALGYNDYTVKFKVTDANIVKDEEETVDTTALEAAIKSAENLTESDYTAASWFDLCVELKEAKDELAAPHTQSTVDEATEHLNAAIKALVKAETKEETKTDVTKLNAVIEKAEALKQRDYTAESWKNLQTALDAAKKLTDATAEQTVVDQAASDLETAILALVKADTENTGTTDKKKKPAVGTVKTVGQIKYKVTGKHTVTVNKYAKKNITKASIPATVKINGYTFKVTAIADSAFSG
jgi:putative polysaccharide lyase